MGQFDQRGDASLESAASGAVPPTQYVPTPTYVPRQIREPETSKKAVWSLVLGICAILFFGLLTAIPGLILGVMAINKIGKKPFRFKGKGLATGGVITSAVGFFFGGLVWIVLFVSVFGDPLTRARESACKANLQAISMTVMLYEAVHEQMPESFEVLIADGVLGERVLHCPLDEQKTGRNYIFRGNDLTEDCPGWMVMAIGDPELHTKKKCKIAYLQRNGLVAVVDYEKFKEVMMRDNAIRIKLGLPIK